MEYSVVSAMNNNVVLAHSISTGEQVILVAKGIGFGCKAGKKISDDVKNGQIFKLWPGGNELSHMSDAHNDCANIETVTRDVIKLAEKRLGIQNPKLYDALLDHIQFAVDRINLGLPIENPFSHEISLLYASEYEIASEAVRMIRFRLKVELGEAEIGLIALHLHSALKGGSVDTPIRKVQMYKEIMQLLIAESAGEESDRRVFLQSLLGLLDLCRRGAQIRFPFPEWEAQLLPQSVALARRIRTLAEKDLRVRLPDEAVGFIAMDVEKLFWPCIQQP